MLMGLAAGAEPDTYTIHTSPEGAEVYLHLATAPGALNAATAPAVPSFVGKSGQPLLLDLAPFIENPTQAPRLTVTFTLKMAGHVPQDIQPNYDLVSLKRWPKTGQIPLVPANSWVALQDFVSEHRLAMGIMVILGSFGLVALGGNFFQRRANRALRARERFRESLITGDTSDPFIGKRLGHYLVVDRLGQGGMAVVYKALPESSLDTAQAVAIKVVSPQYGEDAEFRARFRREVQTYTKLDHPHIVRIIEWGDDPTYLAMELIAGPNLREYLRPGLPIDEVLDLMHALLGALAYAHDRGIVHRDLKPENVMLAPGGRVKVMDFGLAQRRDVSRRLTATGTALGTPDYMSPEQINGSTHPSSDQYALGIMFFELLTGRLPFEGDLMAILLAHMSEKAPPVGKYREEVPEGLQAVVARMLETEAASRFESLAEVLRELEALYPRLRKAPLE